MSGVPSLASNYCVFGKLPSQADFVRFGAISAAMIEFQDWLTDGVEWALSKAPDWQNCFHGGSLRAFAYRTRVGLGGTAIVGAMGPSHDEAGRSFPISVALSLHASSEVRAAPHLLPLLCENVWQSAGDFVSRLKSTPAGSPAEGLATIAFSNQPPLGELRESYAAWSESLPLPELWALIGGGGGVDGLRAVLRFISEAVRPFRGSGIDRTALNLRLPLGMAGGAAVCFWLDVVRRLIGWRDTLPSFFWSHDGNRGELVLHLGRAPLSTIAKLWLPAGGDDDFCDLTRPLPASALQTLAPLSAAVQRVTAETGPVSSLLTLLELGG